MLVKLLKDTHYKGARRAGEIIEINNELSFRWFRNKIAIKAASEEKVLIPEAEEINLASMSAKDLYKECVKNGIDAEAKMERDYYLELLAVKG